MGTPLRVEEPAFRRSLDNFGSLMAGGNLAELLEDSDGDWCHARGHSKRRVFINMETYIFVDDEAGRMFTGALIAARRRRAGPADGGRPRASSAAPRRAEAAGVIAGLPARDALQLLGRRTHRKLMVVDGEIGYGRVLHRQAVVGEDAQQERMARRLRAGQRDRWWHRCSRYSARGTRHDRRSCRARRSTPCLSLRGRCCRDRRLPKATHHPSQDDVLHGDRGFASEHPHQNPYFLPDDQIQRRSFEP